MCLASRHQIGPDLGFHQDAKTGLEMRQKAPHHSRRVPGLPGLQVALFQKFQALGTAGCRAMGEQQAHLRQLFAQCSDQHRCGAGLAQRHGMNPDRRASVRGHRLVVAAKTLVNELPVTRLHHASAQQFAPQQRLCQPHQAGIEPACHASGAVDEHAQPGLPDGIDRGCGLGKHAALARCARNDDIRATCATSGPVRQAVSKL